MADLLTHVLVPYVAVTVAGWRFDVDRHWIPVAMGGAAIPDLVKVSIVVPAARIESVLGVAFTYAPLSSVAGVLAVAGVFALAFDDASRRGAYGWLVAGGLSALVLDGLRMYADGRADYWLYPLPWRPPTPSLYVTSDVVVVVTAVLVASLVLVVDWFVVDA